MEEGDGDGQSRSPGFPATLVGDVRWEPEISAVAAPEEDGDLEASSGTRKTNTNLGKGGGGESGGFLRTPDIEHEPRKGWVGGESGGFFRTTDIEHELRKCPFRA